MTFNSEGRSPTKSVIPSCPHYSTARSDLSSRAVRLFSRHKRCGKRPHPSAYGRRSRQREGRVGGLSESSGKTHPCPRRNPPRQRGTPPRRPLPPRNPSSRNCTRPNATSRRPIIHYHIIPDERPAAPARTNAASENRTTATGRTQSPRASRIAPQNSPCAHNPSSRS